MSRYDWQAVTRYNSTQCEVIDKRRVFGNNGPMAVAEDATAAEVITKALNAADRRVTVPAADPKDALVLADLLHDESTGAHHLEYPTAADLCGVVIFFGDKEGALKFLDTATRVAAKDKS